VSGLASRVCARACELWRKPVALPLLLAALVLAGSAQAVAAPNVPQGEPSHAAAAPAGEHAAAEGEHQESPWTFIGKIVNFVLLVGIVVYFLRAPLADYLARRRADVRAELDAAETMKASAAAQIREMEAKLQALPRELEELRVRGQAEIAMEEQRIRELADAERVRLLDQATREIDQRVRIARRELVEHAANLAVSLAERKITTHITDADRSRLVTQYVERVSNHG
jgi:F-type H+-transporting ATPase subunit b